MPSLNAYVCLSGDPLPFSFLHQTQAVLQKIVAPVAVPPSSALYANTFYSVDYLVITLVDPILHETYPLVL